MAVSQTGLDPWATQLRVGERDARYALGAILGPAPGRVLRWADGVLPSTTLGGEIVDLKVVADAPTPSLSLQLYPGQCIISRDGQGPYICTLDATGRITLDDPDPANARIDVIAARIWDERLGDPQTGFVIEPITGQARPEPAAPELPPGALRLAEVLVPPGTRQITGSAINDLRRAASTRGAIGVLLPGDYPADPGSYTGQARYRRGVLEGWDGQQWRGTHRLDIYDTAEILVRSGETGSAPLASLGVPDPGWPYRLMVSGSAELTTTNCRADLQIHLDTLDGPLLAVGVGPVNAFAPVVTNTRPSGVLTGTHTVHLAAARVFGDGSWATTPYNATLTILRIPA